MQEFVRLNEQSFVCDDDGQDTREFFSLSLKKLHESAPRTNSSRLAGYNCKHNCKHETVRSGHAKAGGKKTDDRSHVHVKGQKHEISPSKTHFAHDASLAVHQRGWRHRKDGFCKHVGTSENRQ